MPTKKVIDWKEAINQVDNDHNFLQEILHDLITEAKEAENEIFQGLQEQNFLKVKNAAHRIKGSSSYLHCEKLQDVSLRLQDSGADAILHPTPLLLKDINMLCNEFKECLNELITEVETIKRK